MPPFAWVESEWRVRIDARRAAAPGAPASVGVLDAARAGARRCSTGGGWMPLRAVAFRLERAGAGRRGRGLPVRAAIRALQADGLVEVEDVLGGQADAFKTVRVAAITDDGRRALGGRPSALGPKQRAALAAARRGVPPGSRSPACGSRGVSADVVERLAERGLVVDSPRAGRARPVRVVGAGRRRRRRRRRRADADRGAGRRLGPAARAGRRAPFRDGAAARRDRERQDRDLPAAGRRRARGGTLVAGARAGDRPDAGAGRRVPGALRRARRHPAQRPVRRRALRPVAAHPARRRRRRRRHALGGVRAARVAGPHRRGRGARRLVQAGREPALPRARRRRHARQARRGARRARLGDAVARELPERGRPGGTSC